MLTDRQAPRDVPQLSVSSALRLQAYATVLGYFFFYVDSEDQIQVLTFVQLMLY